MYSFLLSKDGVREWSQCGGQNNTAQALLEEHIFLDTQHLCSAWMADAARLCSSYGSNHLSLSVRLEIFHCSSNSLPHMCNYFQPYITKPRLGKTVVHERLLYGTSLTLFSWSNARSEPHCLICFPSKVLRMYSWLVQSSLLYTINNENESASSFYSVSWQYHFTKSVSSQVQIKQASSPLSNIISKSRLFGTVARSITP